MKVLVARSSGLPLAAALALAGCSQDVAPQAAPAGGLDAMPAPPTDERLKVAGEVREAAQMHLGASPEEARKNLPSDWAPLLPLEVGRAELDPDGRLRLGAWSLVLDGDRATLDHYPPGAITEQHRLWFRIQLERRGGRWEVLPPGVSFVHAWARER